MSPSLPARGITPLQKNPSASAAAAGGWETGRALGPKSRVRLVPGENVISVRVRQLYYATSTAEPSPVDDGGEGVNRYVNVRRIKVRRVPLALANFAGLCCIGVEQVACHAGNVRKSGHLRGKALTKFPNFHGPLGSFQKRQSTRDARTDANRSMSARSL